MKNVSELYTRPSHPVKVLQFGEGIFLRAFADYAIDIANEEKGFDGSIDIRELTNFLKRQRFVSH